MKILEWLKIPRREVYFFCYFGSKIKGHRCRNETSYEAHIEIMDAPFWTLPFSLWWPGTVNEKELVRHLRNLAIEIEKGSFIVTVPPDIGFEEGIRKIN